jgi:hypothetical protein
VPLFDEVLMIKQVKVKPSLRCCCFSLAPAARVTLPASPQFSSFWQLADEAISSTLDMELGEDAESEAVQVRHPPATRA